MLRDSKGQRLYRRVEIRIFFPDKIFPVKKLHQHAEPHKGFSLDGIDDLLMQTTDQLDQLYPWWEFKMIELKPEGRTARFNFTVIGNRAMTPPEEEKHEA